MNATPTPSAAAHARDTLNRLLGNLESVIRGKRDTLELVLCSVASNGHILLEDIPGTGKTTLAKALALSSGCVFRRIQFTPDLLPTDILGASIFNPQTATFTFKPGPIFANILIADEINRASPRTQSALLEAMSEQQVTLDGETRHLSPPFICIATQNPVEFHGTYPLPEAQLDRFAMQLTLGYATLEDEKRILDGQLRGHPLQELKAVATPQDMVGLQASVDAVRMDEAVTDYLMRLVHASRDQAGVKLGVSMRGALLLSRLARARALLKGRDFSVPDDIKALALPALAHRLVLDTRSRYSGADKLTVMREVLQRVPAPR